MVARTIVCFVLAAIAYAIESTGIAAGASVVVSVLFVVFLILGGSSMVFEGARRVEP